jgi:hypothetical protein
MFAKFNQIGLVSLFVVVAAALGGCAESVASEPASPTSLNRPSIALSRFASPAPGADTFVMVMKTEQAKSRFVKHPGQPVVLASRH